MGYYFWVNMDQNQDFANRSIHNRL